MELDPRLEAQQRADRITLFRRELAAIETERGLLLTPEQRSQLDAHLESVLKALNQRFGIDANDSTRRISWAMRLASLLGGAALIAALVLFLHRVWGGLPTWAHALVLTAAPLPLIASAEFAFRRSRDLFYPALLGLAAGVAFCMELNALGTVLNLAPTPHALLAWGSFAILIAYAHGARLLLAAGLLLLAAYSGCLLTEWQGGYWGGFMQKAQFLLPAAVVLYGLPWVAWHPERPHFKVIYRLCGAFAGFVALLIVSQTGDLWRPAISREDAIMGCQIAGMAFGVLVVVHGIRLGQGALVNVGALGFVVFIYLRLHDWLWDWMPKYLFFLLLGVTALVLLLIFWRLRVRLSRKTRS